MLKVFIWLSTGKLLYYISTQPFPVSNDTGRSKNIQKNVRFVWKIRTQYKPNKQDSYNKDMCINEKS